MKSQIRMETIIFREFITQPVPTAKQKNKRLWQTGGTDDGVQQETRDVFSNDSRR